MFNSADKFVGMNVKSVTTNILPIDLKTRAEAVKNVQRQTQSTTDRDADGKRQQDSETPQRHLKDEEFEEVLKRINALPGIKDSSLVVKAVQMDDHRVIYIEDLSGQIVRRLSEADLWSIYFSNGRMTGQLFDKAA
jgi:hypothetical protein